MDITEAEAIHSAYKSLLPLGPVVAHARIELGVLLMDRLKLLPGLKYVNIYTVMACDYASTGNLDDAIGVLVHIENKIKRLPAEERKQLFDNPAFIPLKNNETFIRLQITN